MLNIGIGLGDLGGSIQSVRAAAQLLKLLFSAGEPGALYDASVLTNLSQDAAGTVPDTAAGQPVGFMLDKSPNGNNATQATATARPLTYTSKGQNVIKGDLVDDAIFAPNTLTQGDLLWSTPYGWMRCPKQNFNGAPVSLPPIWLSSLAVHAGLTDAQVAAAAAIFGSVQQCAITAMHDSGSSALLFANTAGEHHTATLVDSNGNVATQSINADSSTGNPTVLVTSGMVMPVLILLPTPTSNASTITQLQVPGFGPFPDVSKFTALTDITVQGLIGSIPDLTGNPALATLNIPSAGATGGVPDFSGNPALSFISLQSNALTGALPVIAPWVTHFMVSRNQLTGSIPDMSQVGGLTFEGHFNHFTGPVPTLSAQMISFSAESNQITGPLPSLAQCVNLQNFDVAGNPIGGSLPDLSACVKLQQVNVDSCSITGSVPSFPTSILYVFIGHNYMTGSVPDLGPYTGLAYFSASVNQLTDFTGSLPASIQRVQLDSNMLTQTAVDNLLAAAVACGAVAALLNLSGTGNAVPSAAGAANKATLVSRSWTVITN